MKDGIRKKSLKEKLRLNCVPGLKGKTKRQQFIIKVYSLLTIELLITFGFILATMLIDSTFEFNITFRHFDVYERPQMVILDVSGNYRRLEYWPFLFQFIC